MDRTTRSLAARLTALTTIVQARTDATTGPTLADHPHADLLVTYLAVLVREGDFPGLPILNSTSEERMHAAQKAHALWGPGEPSAANLQWIARCEDYDFDGVRDEPFWEAVGGRPESYPPVRLTTLDATPHTP